VRAAAPLPASMRRFGGIALMALSNHERVGKALDCLKDGLQPFVEREMKAQHAQLWFEQAKAAVAVKESQANLFGSRAGTWRRRSRSCGTSGSSRSARYSARRSARW
jgi:hypothetical protein